MATANPLELDEKLLRGPRRDLLEALAILDGRAPTPTIRETADGPQTSTYYHLETLVEGGLIEHDGDEYVSSGDYANVYRLTKKGKQALEREDRRGAALTSTIDLQERMDGLEARIETLEENDGPF